MPFEKGQSGNPNGRQLGTPNKMPGTPFVNFEQSISASENNSGAFFLP